ncbi:MAG: hypothetical protein HQ542_09100 [Bacteroidia bacterium]|nr:hypothetical protein [Bacteroidia bacterium]
MKKLSLFFLLLLFFNGYLFSQVGINIDGSAPNNSAMLDIKSNSHGFLPPRMTFNQMQAIMSPATGLIVYCTNCGPAGTGAMAIYIDVAWYLLNVACQPPAAPTAATHVPTFDQIIWNWNPVTGATGYRWNTTNDYVSAEDLGTVTTKTETGLTCNTAYSRYVWAYNGCGYSIPLTMTQSSSACP